MMSASPDLAESCADTATHTVPSATLLHPLSSIDNDDAIQPGTEAGLLAQGRRKLVRKAAVIETETVEMIAKHEDSRGHEQLTDGGAERTHGPKRPRLADAESTSKLIGDTEVSAKDLTELACVPVSKCTNRSVGARGAKAGLAAELFESDLGEKTIEIDISIARSKLGIPADGMIPGMRVQLKEHQIQALYRMTLQEANETLRGGLLGDTMGVGKTVEILSLILYQQTRTSSLPRATLIVVQNHALLKQFGMEITDKFPNLSWYPYTGDRTMRRLNSVSAFANHDIILTTYGVAYDESKLLIAADTRTIVDLGEVDVEASDSSGPLYKNTWRRIVLDEVSTLRNRGNKFKAVHKLDGMYRWCLDGTPIHNSLSDVYAYIKLLRLQALFDLFWERVDSADIPSKCEALLRPFMIRRLKEDELNGQPIVALAPKTIECVELKLSESERLVLDLWSKGYCPNILRIMKGMGPYGGVVQLRQLSIHPWLLLKDEVPLRSLQFLTTEDLKASIIAKMAASHTITRAPKTLAELDVQLSSDELRLLECIPKCRVSTKMAAVLQVLMEFRDADPLRKTIVFSSSVVFLKALELYLSSQGLPCLVYCGSITPIQKARALQAFRSTISDSYKIILMSSGSGSVGHNLTVANQIIEVDSPWTDAKQAQAFDRAHRMGQTQPVIVKKLITLNTIDQRIMERQEMKRKTAETALGDSAANGYKYEGAHSLATHFRVVL